MQPFHRQATSYSPNPSPESQANKERTSVRDKTIFRALENICTDKKQEKIGGANLTYYPVNQLVRIVQGLDATDIVKSRFVRALREDYALDGYVGRTDFAREIYREKELGAAFLEYCAKQTKKKAKKRSIHTKVTA